MSGIESIMPPVAAVVVALVSKRVTFALFAGIWLAGLLASGGDPITGLASTFGWMTEVIRDDWNARFLLLIALLGSGAAFMFKIGGSHAVARAISRRIRTRKQAQLLPYALGVAIFFNDYVNTVIVGNATRDITRRYRISSEKLSYVIDSTAAPVATIAPISDWIGYQVALIGSVFMTLNIVDNAPYAAFVSSIPWNFYCILAIAAVPMIILTGRDFGPMACAEWRTIESGQAVADGDIPLSEIDNYLGEPYDESRATVWHFLLPLAALIVTTILAVYFSGVGESAHGISQILESTDVSYALLWGAFAMTFTGILLAVARRIPIAECESILLLGFRTMLPALVIMILAWTMAAACNALDTSGYITAVTIDWITPSILPVLVFLIAAAISFTTGTSWGTMAILTPIALPIAHSMISTSGDLTAIYIAIGAIFSGSVLGDHCSPISDTTVMSSTFAGADHVAHVNSQLPYAMVPAAISCVLYLFAGTIAHPLPLLVAGLIVQYLVLRYLVPASGEPSLADCQVERRL